MNDRAAVAIRETGGPTKLPLGPVDDQELLWRNGTTLEGLAIDTGTLDTTGNVLSVKNNGVALGTITHQQVMARIAIGSLSGIILANTTDKLEILLGAAASISEADVTADWSDLDATTFTAGRSSGTTSGTTPVSLAGSPGAGKTRIVKAISVVNRDSVPATVTIRYNANGTTYTLLAPTLRPGETLRYSEGKGWQAIGRNGIRRATPSLHVPVQGMLRGPEWVSGSGGTRLLTSATTYATYLGRADKDFSRVMIFFNVSVIAATIAWAECALATGQPVLGGSADLRVLGSVINLSSIVNVANGHTLIFDASGPEGQDLWFLIGASAGTPPTLTSNLADELLAGFNLSAVAQPSTMAAPTTFAVDSGAPVACRFQLD